MNVSKLILAVALIALIFGCKNQEKETAENKEVANQSAMINAKSENIEIEGSVGTLKGILQMPEMEEGQKYPIVILMHGIFSNKETPLVTQLADGLQEIGIASIRFDFNGHGESDGDFIDMTVPLEVEDAKAVFNYAQQLDFASSISLMGHSQGGVVASLLAGSLGDKVERMTLYAPAAAMEDESAAGRMLGQTFDPENPPEYLEVFDHKVGREYMLTTPKLDIYDRAEEYEGPVCIVQGKQDQVVPYRYAVTYDERYQNSKLYLLEDADHVFENNVEEAAQLGIDFFSKLKTE
ncbi:alpha/beta hydrolase [Zunongwangia sp. SCSIO 43204]|uniref:alpha/beta hydrolase n=1 Tax=Zunongwangia sp. SCSIO 43204 TaxID=2779359 RepID=UPI001CA968C6|nr:alpha/beta hydrolase [Zunongwangia sp. SCSIO 43204]UAB82703.1 alpha/beta hydrolase [Zunongwangia sp. SCSIO 43204]